MKLKIGMSFELDVNSEKSFLNELILETKKAFQQEATGKFLGFILENVDQQMCETEEHVGKADRRIGRGDRNRIGQERILL